MYKLGDIVTTPNGEIATVIRVNETMVLVEYDNEGWDFFTPQQLRPVTEDDREPTEEERKAYWIARYEMRGCIGLSALEKSLHTADEWEEMYWAMVEAQEEEGEEIPEFPMPSGGETVLAVLEQLPYGSTEVRYLCYACEIAQYTPRPTTQADYLETAENIQDMGILLFTFLTQKYDMIWSDNEDTFVGHTCENCGKAFTL